MAFKSAFIILSLCSHIILAIPLDPHQEPFSQPALDYRIVGGGNAEKGSAPHMVALVFGAKVISLTCGGSIVSRRHVLTAAHCVVPFISWTGQLLETLVGVVGSNRWNTPDNLVRFSGHINHPDYDSWHIKNDVGVLILVENIKISDKIDIIPLNFNWVDGDVNSYATGWGRMWNHLSYEGPIPDDLQILHVRTISGQECVDGVIQASQELGWAPPINPQVEICTFHSPNHGMCHGDSGSALVEKHSGQQIGIVSWGFPCAQGAPDVFGRISGFKNFLKPILDGHL
ncbi:chymotrypsin-2-like [Plodia interpunctella]|uniref:chymotrypsin-2-like n=1 Tax=Plodia interpunctella TaxID=58824 RepID=UPI003101678C